MPADDMLFEEYENPRGNISIEGKIAYKGPMQRRGNMSKVKLDLSHDEILVQPAVASSIHHPYTDMNSEDLSIKTYCLEEIFAEKLRALIERMRPRDLYDVIHLHIDERWQPNREFLSQILEEKCRFKDVDVPTLKIVNGMSSKSDLVADWNDMLAHQISGLEPWEHYWEKLPSLFKWLYGE
jgi:predicted nucleotidyltransferase component of viral defense system